MHNFWLFWAEKTKENKTKTSNNNNNNNKKKQCDFRCFKVIKGGFMRRKAT